MVGHECQGEFLADVGAVLVDQGQAVGVGVLAEADVGVQLANLRQDGLQILGRGFRRMREHAVGIAAEDRHLAAECFEERFSQYDCRSRGWHRPARGSCAA